jgi:hypothetical protein
MSARQAERHPVDVAITETEVIVTLNDGTMISNPLAWFPWLADSTPQQQNNYTLYAYSIHWHALDEGIDIEGMLRGIKPAYPQPESVS